MMRPSFLRSALVLRPTCVDQLDPVPEWVVDVVPRPCRVIGVGSHLQPTRRGQGGESGQVMYDKCRVRLAGWSKIDLDPEMEGHRARGEPTSPPAGHRL